MLNTKDLKPKRQPLTSDCWRKEVYCVVKLLYFKGLQSCPSAHDASDQGLHLLAKSGSANALLSALDSPELSG
jgi:hypothetical protein